MKFILSSILALAIAGVPVRVQEPDDKSKPQQEEPKKKPPEPKPKTQPEEKAKPKPDKPPNQEPQQQTDEKQREKQQKEHDKQQKEQSKTDRKSRQPEQPERRPGAPAKGQQIPQEKFRSSFGREHHFRVVRSGGDDRRFRYGGYWFEVVEVWPAGWAFDDDCYLEEDGDDYYLVDVIHPEMRVLVIVVSG